ncbi:MAG: TonB-dependent receptor [Thiogranum sp.]|nr:TonB-dependent receptor [Thiogranum sp.]
MLRLSPALFATAMPGYAGATDAGLLTEDAFLDALPIVLSASRLPQSIDNAPIATSIIDRNMIVASGFTEIPDLLRLAPGFIVNYDNGHTQAVGYHMLHDQYSRQMQVLVDGRSVYEPTVGGVPWTDLALTVDDIERIEVIRGPNAASYGSNSFTAVINIITRHPVLERGVTLKANAGNNGLREGFLRYGGNHRSFDYRITTAWREDEGFDDRFDDKTVKLFNFRGDYALDLANTLMLQLGHSSGSRDADNVFDELIPPHTRNVYGQFQQLKWTHTVSADQEFYVQLYHNQNKDTNDFVTTPIAALGGAQVLLDERRTSNRYDVEFQHRLRPAAALRLVWGASARQDEVNAPAFFNTTRTLDNRIYRIFSNAEFAVTEKTLINAGVSYEDNDIAGSYTSPRLSLNHHFSRAHTARLSVSRAYRAPFLFEHEPDYRFPVPIPNNVLFFDGGDPDPEEITSYEIGYIGSFPRIGASLDAKLFYDRLEHLITYMGVSNPLGLDGTAAFFDNLDNVTIRGIELSAQYQPGDRDRIHINYTHQEIDGTDNTSKGQYSIAGPSDNLNLLASHDFDHGYNASAGFYYLSKMKQLATNDIRGEQKRLDLRFARTLASGGNERTFALVIQNLFDDEQETRLKNNIDRRIYASFAITFR